MKEKENKNFKLDEEELEFIKSVSKKKTGLNPANHNTETKRYAKLSLSLTQSEKEKIKAFKDENYPRLSISSMIMSILEEKGVFK